MTKQGARVLFSFAMADEIAKTLHRITGDTVQVVNYCHQWIIYRIDPAGKRFEV